MKSMNECFEYLNSLRYYSERARSIIEQNTRGKQYPKYEIDDFYFVSGAVFFSEPLFHGKFPGQRCDAGIYWTMPQGKALGVISFDVLENEFAIRQIQGANSKYLGKKEKKWAGGELPWEESLIQIVEDAAKKLEVFKVSIISADKLREERGLKGKHLSHRYDIPAIYRHFSLGKDGYFRKTIR